MTVLQRNSTETIYSQIAKLLKKEISVLFKPGEFLPSEHELAGRFNVNRHTIRRAVDDLIQQGLLERRHGKGTCVLNKQIDYTLGSQTRFTETFETLGKTTSLRVLNKARIPASANIAGKLNVQEHTSIYWIETLRLADEEPICVISHYLPAQHFPDLLNQYTAGSLHEFITQHYKFKLTRIESLVSASLPQGDDASLLLMPHNKPVLRVKSINVNEQDGTPLEYALTRFRSDSIQLRINL